MNKQSGFTLIELVMVIVILGILAATVIPKYIDLSSNAKDAALKGVVGAIQSGSALNYAAYLANNANKVTTAGLTCAAAAAAVLDASSDISNYTVTTATSIGTTTGTATACTVTPNAGYVGNTPNMTANIISVP